MAGDVIVLHVCCQTLVMDLVSQGGGTAQGAAQKAARGGGLFGRRRNQTSAGTGAGSSDGTDGSGSSSVLEPQVKKLRVRARALCEALVAAVPEAPEPLLLHLNELCTKRVQWPYGGGGVNHRRRCVG